MHWAYKKAEELIQKNPGREIFVCASGISPSGSVHVGNFREAITTYFIAKALRYMGKRTRVIFSWDDFDRFRKVPTNIDSSFEAYIGMPYSDIPDPFGCHSSYAAHFETEFEESMKKFGMEAEFIYQSKEYRSKRYNNYILHALQNRGKIYEILTKYKTNKGTQSEKESFYPITLYCEKCRTDFTTVQKFDEQNGTLSYSCSCGHFGTIHVAEATMIKLNWKVDWPMRWMVEDVVFEPGGRDHSSETGSYTVSKEISEKIFNHRPPVYQAYDFIGLKGSQEKMSSSSGNLLTPEDLLKIYSPENILYLFAKYQPDAAFHFGLDEEVIKNHTEFERARESHKTVRNAAIELSVRKESGHTPKFSQVASILPLINFDLQLLQKVLEQTGETYSLESLMETSSRAEYWIKTYNPEKMVQLNQRKDIDFYETLTSTERKWISELCQLVRRHDLSAHQFMKEVYEICRDEDKKRMKTNQARLFLIVYQLVLNRNSGPRLPLLVQAAGKEHMANLLDF